MIQFDQGSDSRESQVGTTNDLREKTGDEMINSLMRMVHDSPSDLFQYVRNRQALDNTRQANIVRRQRIEIERTTSERTIVSAGYRPAPSSCSELHTGSTSSRSKTRLRSVRLSVLRSRNEVNIQGRRSVTSKENSNVRNQHSISLSTEIRELGCNGSAVGSLIFTH